MDKVTHLHHPVIYQELDIAASDRFSVLSSTINQGDLLIARPTASIDNRMAEVIRFMAAYPDRKHIVQVRSMGTAHALRTLLDHPARRVAVLSMDEAKANGCHGHASYLNHALASPEFRIIVGMQTILSQGWSTYDPNLAISCTFDLREEMAGQLACRLRTPDAKRMIFVTPDVAFPIVGSLKKQPSDPEMAYEQI